VLPVVVSFIVFYCVTVFLYCVCALFVCNICYLSVVLLYYCHQAEAQLQINKYIYIYIYIFIFIVPYEVLCYFVYANADHRVVNASYCVYMCTA
jgi:hypothetical protein